MTAIITVTGKDRPGIIATLTGAIYKTGGNLEDASMTILEGEFAMIFLAALKGEPAFSKLQKRFLELARRSNLAISIEKIKHRLVRGEKHRPGTLSWVVSVLGKDRAGIVYQISKLLADYKINITDLNSKIIGKGKKTTYALVLEVDVPRKHEVAKKLKRNFETLQKKMGVTIVFNPIESSSF